MLDSLLTTQEAEVEEMTSMIEKQGKGDDNLSTFVEQASPVSRFESESEKDAPILPPKIRKMTPKIPPPPPPRKTPFIISLTKRSDAALPPQTTTKTSEAEASHDSSDEGEESLTLMRDSPRWEEEEIQAEDSEMQRPIKAEIKLLVKTTEVGKESIEIRSIREFVDPNDKHPDELSSSEVLDSDKSKQDALSDSAIEGKGSFAAQQLPPLGRTPSPRFVRPSDTYPSFYERRNEDDFDLMAQVRGKPCFWLALRVPAY